MTALPGCAPSLTTGRFDDAAHEGGLPPVTVLMARYPKTTSRTFALVHPTLWKFVAEAIYSDFRKWPQRRIGLVFRYERMYMYIRERTYISLQDTAARRWETWFGVALHVS